MSLLDELQLEKTTERNDVVFAQRHSGASSPQCASVVLSRQMIGIMCWPYI